MNFARLILALCAAAGAAGAMAHPMLEHAEPRVGATVAVAPREVRIWFSEDLQPGASTAEVTDADGQRVDTGAARVDPNEPVLLRVPLRHLGPGTYTATWHAVSADDTHGTEGRFTFHVGP